MSRLKYVCRWLLLSRSNVQDRGRPLFHLETRLTSLVSTISHSSSSLIVTVLEYSIVLSFSETAFTCQPPVLDRSKTTMHPTKLFHLLFLSRASASTAATAPARNDTTLAPLESLSPAFGLACNVANVVMPAGPPPPVLVRRLDPAADWAWDE